MRTTANRTRVILTFTLVLAVAGCSSQGGAAKPAETARLAVPAVQDCAVVAISSPPKYACNGKVYTAFDLQRLRAQEQKKYQSRQ